MENQVCDGSGYLPRSMGELLPDGTRTGMCISCMQFHPVREIIPPSRPERGREFRLAEHTPQVLKTIRPSTTRNANIDPYAVEFTDDTGEAVVHVQFFFGEQDGMPVVQIDAESNGDVRVNLNDGELATVEDGSDITLPEHWREFALPYNERFERARCGCGYSIVRTPEGWQHDAAPYFWGGDHDADPS